MLTDPIADLLTRIRNGQMAAAKTVNVPSSKLKIGVVKALKREGYLQDFSVIEDKKQGVLRIHLKYGPDGEVVMRKIERVSKPGRRIYRKSEELEPVVNGFGIAILSTSKGVLSDRECRTQKVGGEVLAKIW